MWRIVLDEYRNIVSLIVIVLLLTAPYAPRRSRYALRLIIGIALCLALVLLYLPLHGLIVDIGDKRSLVTIISVLWYLFTVFLAGGLAAFCHKISFTELVWIMITAYAVHHIVYVITVEFVFFAILKRSRDVLWQMLASAVVAALLYFVVYKLFMPNMKKSEHLYFGDNMYGAIALVLFFSVFFASTFVNQANARQNGVNILSMISDFVNCLFVIVAQYISLRNMRMKSERDALSVMLKNEKKQYETFRNAVEYIDIKCHDLKHEIAAWRCSGGGEADTDRIEEITENISIYESFAKTGNRVLDALITDKNFICKNNGISLSCIADASEFSSMENEDIYCLFGNIMDNAIDYVRTVDEAEKRFIRLFVKAHDNIKIIHQENYFDGKLSFVSGIPETTKPDKINHGFGMKSIKRIVEKYGGEMQVVTEDNMYKIDIVLTK